MHNFICRQALCINFRAVCAKLYEKSSGQNSVHRKTNRGTDGQPGRFQYTPFHFIMGGGGGGGYNEYLHKSNIYESNLCQSGEIESVKHYWMECELYKNEREKMRRKLFEIKGIAHSDMILLFDAKQNDEFKDWKSLILSELESFVAGTNHFSTLTSN